VRVKAAIPDFAMLFDIPHQHACDQVAAEHEEHNDAHDAGALK